MNESEPLPGAVTLLNAMERYGDPKLYAAWKEVKGRVEERNACGLVAVPPVIARTDISPRETKARRDAHAAYHDAGARLSDNIRQQLIVGKLSAWARDGKPAARWVMMPADAWESLTLNWSENTACANGGITYFNIHVSPTVFVDSRWDGGLPLLEACKLMDPILAEDLTAPWTPTLPDGEPDQDWADFDRMYAAGEMWVIICRWHASYEITLYFMSPDDGEWHHIYELTSGLNEGDCKRVDFVESRIRLDAWEEPVPCLLMRYDEDPSDLKIYPRLWSEVASATEVVAPPLKPPRRERHPAGRKPGSGSYDVKDQGLLDEMKSLIESGEVTSVQKAAEAVAGRAHGGGTEASKADRLARKYGASKAGGIKPD